ncbi:hypothetical protein AB5J49_25495 [Streptomyces sp. R28]|uniref:Uncharacterized protein n=1 Tax=Streptomyces sp. R28 TaxID=3238628 RepID=A0AB39Q1R6_9ACTN
MEDVHGPWTPAEMAEYDRLSEQLSSLTTRLADFAQAITVSLPVVRAAHSSRGDDRG